MISPVHAALASVARTTNATFVYAGAQSDQAFIATGFIDGANGHGSGGGMSPFRGGNCELGDCPRLYAAATGRAERLPWGADSDYGMTISGAPGYGSASDDASEMTRQDFALMMLFAGALVAYQLDRKQRVLRQSSLSELSL
jgi:hypothetical protein